MFIKIYIVYNKVRGKLKKKILPLSNNFNINLFKINNSVKL